MGNNSHFVADGGNSHWAFCVTWLEGQGSLAGSGVKTKNSKIDYREVLNEADFTVYARLRELRKTLSEQEATAAYNIFTNEQLAELVRQRVTSKSQLLAIEGIGQTRADKYAEVFLACLNQELHKPAADETHSH